MSYLTTEKYKQMETYQKMVDELDGLLKHFSRKSELMKYCDSLGDKEEACEKCVFGNIGCIDIFDYADERIANDCRRALVKKMDEIDPEWAEMDLE